MQIIASNETYERTVDIVDYARRVIFDMPQSQVPVFSIKVQRMRFEWDSSSSEILSKPDKYEYVRRSDEASLLNRTTTINETISGQTAQDNGDGTATVSMAHVLEALENILDEIALEVKPA